MLSALPRLASFEIHRLDEALARTVPRPLRLGGVGASQQMVERFLDRHEIQALPNTAIKEVREIEFEKRCHVPFAYSMIVPPRST